MSRLAGAGFQCDMNAAHDEREERAVVRRIASGTLGLPVPDRPGELLRGSIGSLPRYDQYTTARLLEAYEAGPGRLRAAMAGLGLDELRARPRPGKWSILEIAVHVADSELMGAGRIRLATAQPGAAFVAYDQELFATRLQYHSFTLDELETTLGLFELLRRSTLPLFEDASADDWTGRWGTHPEHGPITLRNLLELYADHGERHIEQILTLRRLLHRPLELEILLPERLY